MPNKFNDPHRHKFKKARYRVTNWPDYDRGLVDRGRITFWISDDAFEKWRAAKRKTRGGQPEYSDTAVETTLLLGEVFGWPLRQTEGFVTSLLQLMGRDDLKAPDHTTLSRRRRRCARTRASQRSGPVDIVIDSTGLKFYGPGEWDRLKHGERRRNWRKLHVAVDPVSGEVLVHTLTDSDTSDTSVAPDLLAALEGDVGTVFADGAYDGEPSYERLRIAHSGRSPPKIVIPPCTASIPEKGTVLPEDATERDRHAWEIANHGRMAWQKAHNYGKRALGETAIGRFKRRGGERLSARSFEGQKAEAAIRIEVINREIRHCKPVTIRAN